MIKLGAQATVSDYMLQGHGMSKSKLEEYVNHQIARSFANELVKNEEFQENVVKRELSELRPWSMGDTIYECRMVLFTLEEAKEYKELLEFKKQLQRVTFS